MSIQFNPATMFSESAINSEVIRSMNRTAEGDFGSVIGEYLDDVEGIKEDAVRGGTLRGTSFAPGYVSKDDFGATVGNNEGILDTLWDEMIDEGWIEDLSGGEAKITASSSMISKGLPTFGKHESVQTRVTDVIKAKQDFEGFTLEVSKVLFEELSASGVINDAGDFDANFDLEDTAQSLGLSDSLRPHKSVVMDIMFDNRNDYFDGVDEAVKLDHLTKDERNALFATESLKMSLATWSMKKQNDGRIKSVKKKERDKKEAEFEQQKFDAEQIAKQKKAQRELEAQIQKQKNDRKRQAKKAQNKPKE